MSKVRVYELAKELNVRNQDLLTLLQRLGVDAKNHMSVIDEALARQITERFRAVRQKAPAPGAAAAPAAAGPSAPAAAPAPAPAPPAPPAAPAPAPV
ncbi:MAG: translation initiation factor IF-2 N-terminal domain-containing protein, partial [Chitinophagales bacterium]